MERKSRIVLFVALVFSVMALGATGAPAQAAPTVYTLRFSTYLGQTHYHGAVIVKALNELQKAAGGRLKINSFWSGSMIQQGKEYEAVNSGAVDMIQAFYGPYSKLAPNSQLFSLPFVSDNLDALILSTRSGELPSLLAPQWEKENVKLLSLYPSDPYSFITSKRLIKRPEDLKGLKLRTGGAVDAHWMELCGATPVIIPTPDQYMAMKLKTVDGTSQPWGTIVSRKLYEVNHYYTWGMVNASSNGFLINKNVWAKLPSDLQKLLYEYTQVYMCDNYCGTAINAVKVVLKDVLTKAGYETYTLTKDDIAAFRKVTDPTKAWFVEKLGADAQTLDKAFAVIKKYER
jgi:TRAP-type C4-dicarboxylate transport system substrate-binding protein